MIIQIISVAIITTVLALLLKQYKMELAMCVSLAGGMIILFIIAPYIKEAINILTELSDYTGIDNEYIKLLIRVISIAYITEFGAGIARDAGEVALASKVELGGKMVIFSICIPILITLIKTVIVMLG